MGRVIIIGGGPSGMMAAGTAARGGAETLLLEKNGRLGRKLCLTGKGRCNVGNDTDTEGLIARVNANPRFLYGAFSRFTSADTRRFFEDLDVPVKTERGRRMFPASGRAADIAAAMERYASRARILLNTAVRAVEAENGQVRGVRTARDFIPAEAVIVAAGGLSYPATGSTGDGYRFARALGHRVTPLYPSLTPFHVDEPWVGGLAGLTLKNVRVSLARKGAAEPLFAETGELLFTHDGVSGPLVLTASRYTADKPGELRRKCFVLGIDLKPALDYKTLDARILRDFGSRLNKDFINALDGLLPGRLTGAAAALSGVPPERKVRDVTRAERARLGACLKQIILTPVSAGSFAEAVVTMGGVDTREIDPATMMSKKIKGLYFTGETLDVDAMTGGYNLQIAFSTGCLAGRSAADETRRGGGLG